jgi:nicotinate-nucleotide pyrophosphorylase
VTLENVREVAESGVHRISVVAVSLKKPGADVALEIRSGGSDATGVAR